MHHGLPLPGSDQVSERPPLEAPRSSGDRTLVRDRWWRDPYLVVAIPVGLWAILVTLRHTWTSDFLLHLATVDSLARDLWDPVDPLVGQASGSPYYSPYALLLGATKAATGLSARTVLEFAGMVNVALLLFALRRFCRHLGGGRLAAALALVFTLLLWGIAPVAWSGFLGLYSLSWIMCYPSVIGTALMLLVWDAFLRHRSRPEGMGALATVALLGALVVLIHPFTAVSMTIGLVAFVLADPKAALRARPLGLAAGAAAAFLLVMAWPWSDVSTLFGAAGSFNTIHKVLITNVVKDGGFAAYGLALVGLPALATGGRRPLGRELQILFLLAVTVISVGAATGSYGLARAIPVAMLPLHLALASYLAERAKGWRPYAAVALIACCVGLYGESAGLIRAYWRNVSPATLRAWGAPPPAPSYDHVLEGIEPGEVVITDDWALGRLVNARGAYTVVPAWPYPFVDEAARTRDTTAFFAPDTAPRDRLAIAERYGVTCALVTRDRAILKRDALPGFTVTARMTFPRAVRLCRS
ncbi:hypothetical protein [Actinoallomurus sp. CA-150999]|uniref:hypothetical protein n=1 Tax=Actinoallomurus sp. CA-150999 TaxID=3239887 RepID=UPI003D8EBCAA